MRAWIRAARPVAHGMIALPLLVGQTLAVEVSGRFELGWAIAIQLWGVGYQAFILYLNDHADEALDRANEDYWLSGGSRVIPDGELTGAQLLRGALVVLAALALALVLAALAGRAAAAALGALVLAAGWTYSLKPLASSYAGLGELHQGLTCGLALPALAFTGQGGTLGALPWAPLLPLVGIYFAGNVVTGIPDGPSDAAGGKRSYTVRHGEARARRDSALLLAACYLALGALLPGAFLAAIPALALLGHAARSGAAGDRKGFVLHATLSQAWMVTALWLLLLARAIR